MSEALAGKLKLARKKLELTQVAFAAHLGVPVGTLSHWEQDIRTPRGFALTALNEKLDAILQPEPPPPPLGSPKRRRPPSGS